VVKRKVTDDEDDDDDAADSWVEYAVAIGVGLGAGILLKLLKGGGIGIDLSLPKLPRLKLRPQRRVPAAPVAAPPMDPLSGTVALALCGWLGHCLGWNVFRTRRLSSRHAVEGLVVVATDERAH
jgi:hypothetical protein